MLGRGRKRDAPRDPEKVIGESIDALSDLISIASKLHDLSAELTTAVDTYKKQYPPLDRGGAT